MYQGKTVAVVIVAYNEEGLVGDVIETLPSFIDRAYIVDDGSTDGTWDEIQEHAQRINEQWGGASGVDTNNTSSGSESRPESAGIVTEEQDEMTQSDGGVDQPIEPISHETNKGVGAAVKTGYRRAYEDGVDITVTMAGDGQMDPDECHRIVDPVATGKADYAKGNRLLDSELREEMSSWRLFGNTLLTILTKIASGYWKMMDPANGYTAISRNALDELDIDAIYEDYGSLHDVLVRLNVHNMRVADVPIPAAYGEEESGIQYTSFVPKLSKLLFRDFLWRLHVKYLVRDCHPFVLFYAFGVIGGVAGLIETVRGLIGDDSPSRKAATVVLFVLSGALIAFAMTFDMLDNEDLEVQIRE